MWCSNSQRMRVIVEGFVRGAILVSVGVLALELAVCEVLDGSVMSRAQVHQFL